MILLVASSCADFRDADDAQDDTAVQPAAATTGPPGTTQYTIISLSYWWAYYDGPDDQGTSWRYPADYGIWPTAPPPLGYGETYLTTTISSGPDPANKPTTAYFRREFDLDRSRVKALFLRIMYDDGFVFYLNGREGGRASMPSGPVSFSTLALGHEAENRYRTFDISAQIPDLAENGYNALAVEVHQASRSSSDLVFSAELIAWMDIPIDITTRSDIPRRSYWHLWDRGGDLGTAWRTPSFDDSVWSAGPAPLGFGEDYLSTPIASGPITSYFRKQFTVEGPVRGLRGEVMYDDGFVVYLNGQEIGRAAMPSGAVTAATLSSGHEANAVYRSFDWSAAVPLLHPGTNTIAVEVHQVSSSSSDLVFDLALEVQGPWYQVPGGAQLHASAIWFVDALNGWALGGKALWRTGDGGQTWSQQHLDTSAYLRKIQFVDALHGWIVGEAGTILATRDGGATWQRQSAGVTRPFSDLSFIDATTGWVIASDELPEGDTTAAMYKTTDGGATWSPQAGDVHRAFFSAIAFADANHGWVAAATFDDLYEHAIYGTSDGGATWTRQWTGGVATLADVEALTPTTAWVAGWSNPHAYFGELALVTHDGASWSSAPETSNQTGLLAIDFIDAQHGWATGNAGSIIATSDGGATWTVQREARTSDYGQSTDEPELFDVHFVDRDRGWALGNGRNGLSLFRTTTGGM